ncbi:MAG: YdgA family protein [Legionellaceae bacterium]|nr:YdgA family protein [Legionellaceae bacterium]
MKKLVGFVVILAALVLGCYYGMGVLTERTLKKNIDVLNQSNGVTVVLKQYKRGWFTSDAMLDWTLTVPARDVNINGQTIKEPEQTFTAQMPLGIDHGPFIFANSNIMFGLGYANSHVLLPAQYEDKFTEQYTPESIKPSLELSAFVSYLNNTCLQLIAPKFNLISKQGNNTFQWLGMSSEVKITSNKKHISGQLMINGLTWLKDHVKGVLTNIKSDYDLHVTPDGLYLGDANLYLPAAVVTKDNDALFEVKDLEAHSSSQVTKGLFSSSFKLALNRLFLNQKEYTSCSVDLSIKNLDSNVLTDMNSKLSKTHQGSDSDRQRVLLSMLPDISLLVNKGAVFEMSDLTIGMPNGVIKGKVIISLPHENVTNPFQLIQKIKGNGKLSVSAAVLKTCLSDSLRHRIQASVTFQQAMAQSAETQSEQNKSLTVEPPATEPAQAKPPVITAAEIDQQAMTQADQKIAELLKSGVILAQGMDYVTEFKVADGQLLINGKAFNPAMLQL